MAVVYITRSSLSDPTTDRVSLTELVKLRLNDLKHLKMHVELSGTFLL